MASFLDALLAGAAGALEGVSEARKRESDRGQYIKDYIEKQLPRLDELITQTSDQETIDKLTALKREYEKLLAAPDHEVPKLFQELQVPVGAEVSLSNIFDSTKKTPKVVTETPQQITTEGLAEAADFKRRAAILQSEIPELTQIVVTGKDSKGRSYTEEERQRAAEVLNNLSSGKIDFRDFSKLKPLLGFDPEEFTKKSPQEQARQIIEAGWGTYDPNTHKLTLNDNAPPGLKALIESGAIVPDFRTYQLQRVLQSAAAKKAFLENDKLEQQIRNLASTNKLTEAQVQEVLAQVDRLNTLTPLEKEQLKQSVLNMAEQRRGLKLDNDYKAATFEDRVRRLGIETESAQLQLEYNRQTFLKRVEHDNRVFEADARAQEYKAKSMEADAKLKSIAAKLSEATYPDRLQAEKAKLWAAQITAYADGKLSAWSVKKQILADASTMDPEVIKELPNDLFATIGLDKKLVLRASIAGKRDRSLQLANDIVNMAVAHPPKTDAERQVALDGIDRQLQAAGITDPHIRNAWKAIVNGAWAGYDVANAISAVNALWRLKNSTNDPTTVSDVTKILNTVIDNTAAEVQRLRDYLVQQGCASYISDLAVKYHYDKTPVKPEKPGQTCRDLIGEVIDTTQSYRVLQSILKRSALKQIGLPKTLIDQILGPTSWESSAPRSATPSTGVEALGTESASPVSGDFHFYVSKLPKPEQAAAQHAFKTLVDWYRNSATSGGQPPTWVVNLITGLANSLGVDPGAVGRWIREEASGGK